MSRPSARLAALAALAALTAPAGARAAETPRPKAQPAELEKFVFEVPRVARPRGAEDVVRRIHAQVARIVAADRHDLIGARLWSMNNQLLWGHGRAVASIAQTMPYLPADLADKVRAYLAREVSHFLLDPKHMDREFAGSAGTAKGVRNFGISWSKNGAFRWDALYGLWAYAHYTGDWARIQRGWSAVKALHTRARQNADRALGTNASRGMGTVSGINSQIAGLMGLARMARRTGDSALAAAAASAAVEKLRAKLAQLDAGPVNPITLLPNTWRQLGMPAYIDLTPDLCRVLAAFRKDRATAQIAAAANRFRTWPLGDMDHVSDWMGRRPFPPVTAEGKRPGEEGFQASIFASPIFLVRAYVVGVDVRTLREELPMAQSSRTVPHYLDMLRLQHLVALAHRSGGVTWKAE